MTEDEATAMLAALAKHFREPVMPITRYCDALETWQRCVGERDARAPSSLSDAVDRVFLAITKSNLLARLLYAGEPLRTIKCPVHEGRWSGISPCEHGCGETGWVPDGWPDAAPRCTTHPDRPSVASEVSARGARHLCWECYRERWTSLPSSASQSGPLHTQRASEDPE